MISNNVYLRFQTFNDEESVMEFIKNANDFKSNSKNWQEDVHKLLKYKNSHLRKFNENNQYRNIFGYYLKIMIPIEMNNKVDEFVREVMVEIDKRFLKNLYVYKQTKQGKGQYAEIICFTRYVYKKPRKTVKRYQRDYYYNRYSKKICKKDDPNAELKAKQGDVVVDKNNQKIMQTVEVKEIEDRIFVYRTIQSLTRRLKKAVITVIKNHQYHDMIIKIISRITIDQNDSKLIKKFKRIRNIEIRKINKKIESFIQHIVMGNFMSDEEIRETNEQWCIKIDEMIYDKKKSFDDIKDYLHTWWQKNILVALF